MTKPLIALALAAAFGFAHAADVKTTPETKPAAAPTAAVQKEAAPKTEGKTVEAATPAQAKHGKHAAAKHKTHGTAAHGDKKAVSPPEAKAAVDSMPRQSDKRGRTKAACRIMTISSADSGTLTAMIHPMQEKLVPRTSPSGPARTQSE